MIKAIIILAVVLVVLLICIIALRFKSFKNWLVYAVSEAEKALGGGTGKLKIRYAYDLAIKQFPVIAKIIPWNLFSWLIDSALVIMREMISENKNIAEVIEQKLGGKVNE